MGRQSAAVGRRWLPIGGAGDCRRVRQLEHRSVVAESWRRRAWSRLVPGESFNIGVKHRRRVDQNRGRASLRDAGGRDRGGVVKVLEIGEVLEGSGVLKVVKIGEILKLMVLKVPEVVEILEVTEVLKILKILKIIKCHIPEVCKIVEIVPIRKLVISDVSDNFSILGARVTQYPRIVLRILQFMEEFTRPAQPGREVGVGLCGGSLFASRGRG
jgi:hypothetical protein